MIELVPSTTLSLVLNYGMGFKQQWVLNSVLVQLITANQMASQKEPFRPLRIC